MKRAAATAALLVAATALATPSGSKWFPNSIPVKYQVFAHTTINGMPANSFSTQVLPRVQEAFTIWTSSRVNCTSWRSVCDNGAGGCTATTPSGSVVDEAADGKNTVIWLTGAEWEFPVNTLGVTTVYSYAETGEIGEADLMMNNNMKWKTSPSTNQTDMEFDFESVMAHEAGHFLGLDHTLDPSNPNLDTGAVMYKSLAPGQIKRLLAAADRNDVCTVYPATSGNNQGNPCTSQSQCTGGLVCRGLPGSMGKICTIDCTSSAGACATVAPLTCRTADTGSACLPPPASSDYCKHCLDGPECSTGRCVGVGVHSWCTNSCSAQSPCPAGSVCLSESTGMPCGATGACVCAPQPINGAYRCPGQCTGSTCGMTPGFKCTNTTCEPATAEGDRCELHGVCDNCLLCVGSSSTYFCRRCCGGNGGGGACNQCTNMTCAAAQTCTALSGTNDGVCLPSMGADVCQACGAGTTCLNGNTCIGGVCHGSCNPATPGACPACVATGAGTNVCACTGEVRELGQACGTTPTLQACRNGLVCANGTCRTGCSMSASNCPTGQICQTFGSVTACAAAPAGSTCAACNGTMCGPDATCHLGRCYQRCNVNVTPGPCQYACIDVGNGVNVCACPDQIGGEGATCGSSPISACNDGLLCIAGTCSGECNPNDTTACPVLKECRLLPGSTTKNVCQPINMGTGGGGAGGGTNRLDCTPNPDLCPVNTECIPNGDGTATCKPVGMSCDPNSPTTQCPSGLICRSVDNQVGVFRCLTPSTGNNGGCGCSSGEGLLLALVVLIRRWRR
ncbi:MAG: matrixin family metalloprotease [Myxococcaceae bacterium]|nr:matrixin family metalloprotease [Myxococcaceae bacterium]